MSKYVAAVESQQRLQKKKIPICDTWGDPISKKANKNIRLVFQNIRGFGIEQGSYKSETIREFMEDHEVDIMAMSELNVNWRIISKKNTINEITRGWFENQRVITSYNQRDRTCKKFQPGGTAIISRDEMALRVMESGQDTRKIGRWSWQLLRGKNNIKLRVISIYFPCTMFSDGFKTVVSQQQKALLQMKQTGSVWKNYWVDLWRFVDKCLEEGDQIIVGGDWNADVRQERFQEEFRKRFLVPAIINAHGNEGPETYNRGRKPIDEIFITSTLEISACGYLEHGKGLSDHRPLWIDITKISALGAKLPDIPTYQARRLKCQDPRIVNKYNNTLEQNSLKGRIFIRLHNNLYNSYVIPLSQEQIEELEDKDRVREDAMLIAEKNVGN